MNLSNILFIAAISLWVIAILLLIPVQLNMMSKYGRYSSAFKKLTQKQIKAAKTSGALFVAGSLILILGFVARDSL